MAWCRSRSKRAAVQSATIQHFAIGMVDQRGRLDRVTKSYVSSDNFKYMAVNAISAGLTKGIGQYMGVNTTQMNGFMEQLKGNGVKCMSDFLAQTAVHGKPGEALKHAGIHFGVDTVVGTLTNNTGERRAGQIGPQDTLMLKVLHKLEHALLGAAKEGATAALEGKKGKELSEAALGGAVGGATAEILAESLMPAASQRVSNQLEAEGLKQGNPAYKERYNELKGYEIEKIKAYGQLAAVGVANALGVDVQAAQAAALNAIENNSSQVMQTFAQLMLLTTNVADAPDFSEEHNQAKEAEETCDRVEKELDELLEEWGNLKEEQELLERGRYRPSSGGTASTAKDMSGLLFDVATQDKRVSNIQATNATKEKMRGLVAGHDHSVTTLDQLDQRPHLMRTPQPRQSDTVERARKTLSRVPSSPPNMVGESSSSSMPTMTMMGTAAAATAPMSRAMAFRVAALGADGVMLEGGAALRGLAAMPKDPRFLAGAALAAGGAYAAHESYEWYKENQRTADDRAAAQSTDLRKNYDAFHASQGQAVVLRFLINLYISIS